MKDATLWYLIVGGLLVWMALAGSVLKRLPLSASMLYLLVGVGIGPHGLGLLTLDALTHSAALERVAEVAVLVSLFTAGLKMRVPLKDRRWLLPLRLAVVSMVVTVGLVTLVGVNGLDLPVGAAVLLGAVLAPTDPVLASDVQMESPTDRDRLRFGLTGEAGLNDGTAFPFVMLGLGLLGLRELGPYGGRWWAVDVAWAGLAGPAVGFALGTAVAALVLYLRRIHREAVGLDDFLGLGLIALSYGVAELIGAYGFLAVFAAGLALRRVEMAHREDPPADDVRAQARAGASVEMATDPAYAPAYMTEAVLGFNEQLERIAEVVVVVLLGSLLSPADLDETAALWFIPLLFLILRPAAVAVGVLGTSASLQQRLLMGWFGIRGLGSVYYLMFAVDHGLPLDLARRLTALTLLTVAASVAVHGISVTPLMNVYRRTARRK